MTISYGPALTNTSGFGTIDLGGDALCAGDFGVLATGFDGTGTASVRTCGLIVATGFFGLSYGPGTEGTFIYVGNAAGGELTFMDLAPTGAGPAIFGLSNPLALASCAGPGIGSASYLGSLTIVDP
jgi:hypothetical protein